MQQRTIILTVRDDTQTNRIYIQNNDTRIGYAGEHKATVITFNLPESWIANKTAKYQLYFLTADGKKYCSEMLETAEFALPSVLMAPGGLYLQLLQKDNSGNIIKKTEYRRCEVASSVSGIETISDAGGVKLVEELNEELQSLIADTEIAKNKLTSEIENAQATERRIKSITTLNKTILFDGDGVPIWISDATSFSGGAGAGLTKAKTLFVPSTVTAINGGAFSGCNNITDIYIDNTADNIDVSNEFSADIIHYNDSDEFAKFSAVNLTESALKIINERLTSLEQKKTRVYFRKNCENWTTPRVYLFANPLLPLDYSQPIIGEPPYHGTPEVWEWENAPYMLQDDKDPNLYYYDLPTTQLNYIVFYCDEKTSDGFNYKTSDLLIPSGVQYPYLYYWQSPIGYDGIWANIHDETFNLYFRRDFIVEVDGKSLKTEQIGEIRSKDSYMCYRAKIPLSAQKIKLIRNHTYYPPTGEKQLYQLCYNVPVVYHDSLNYDENTNIHTFDGTSDPDFMLQTQYTFAEYALYRACLSDLKERETTLNRRIDDMSSEISGLRTTVKNNYDTVGQRIGVAETDINQLKSRTTAAENDISSNESNITNLQTRTTAAENSISANEANITTNTAAIAELQGYIGYSDNDIVGLQVDYENKQFTRLAGAAGKTAGADFDVYPMYGGRRRCNVADDGTINAYYGDENYTEDGINGQVMVYQPAFYYRVVPLKLEPNTESGIGYHVRKANYYVSAVPKPGFKLHPAFYNESGAEVDYILLSAYEGTLYSNHHFVNDISETSADMDVTADLLCSVSGVKPISGKYKEMTVANMEALAANHGNGWHLNTIKAVSANQLLLMIEYGTMNSQAAIGQGIVNLTDDGVNNCASVTGATSSLGNATGQISETTSDGDKAAVTYRGVENPWGNIWDSINGVNIWGDGAMCGGQPYVADDFAFNSRTHSANYKPCGFTLPNESGYIDAMGYGGEKHDWLLMPSMVGGTSALPVGDYCNITPNLNSYRVVSSGGYWIHKSWAGNLFWGCTVGADGCGRHIGGRLLYVPQTVTGGEQ